MIFGLGCPMFMSTGVPDYATIKLDYAFIKKLSFSEPRMSELVSVITGKRKYDWLGDWGSFTITVNLFPYANPSVAFNTIAKYLHQQVILYPYRDGASLGDGNGLPVSLLAATITNITNATVPVITAPGHGLTNGALVSINRVVGMSGINGWQPYINYIDADHFSVNIDTTAMGVYASGGVVSKYTPFFINSITPYYKEDIGAQYDVIDIEFIASDYIDMRKSVI